MQYFSASSYSAPSFKRRRSPSGPACFPARNEAYVTHRQAGKVSVIDAKSYKVVKTFDTPTHPNSLALSADGKTLYVSVKQKSTKQQEATQPDDVIRIAL